MKKFIFPMLICGALGFNTTFATNYDFYNPITPEVDYSDSEKIFPFLSGYSQIQNNFSGFYEYNIFCIVPKKDSQSLENLIIKTTHLFSNFARKPHTTYDIGNAAKEIFTYLTPLQGVFNGKNDLITQVRVFERPQIGEKNITTARCEIVGDNSEKYENFNTWMNKKIFANIKNDDQITFHIQYPVNTTIKTRYLSPKSPLRTIVLKNNFANSKNVENIKITPDFLCFDNNKCTIKKAIITHLNGKTTDITEKIIKYSKNLGKYSLVDEFFEIPADSQKIIFTYQKMQ